MSETQRTIITVAIANIHPDPFQPRIHPDGELADSIKSQGVLQIFSVERIQPLEAVCPDCGKTFDELSAAGGQYMISDGERRWRGAAAAGLKFVDVEVVPIASPGRRLIRQVTANTGKPLTAVEQGMAYASIIEEEKLTQAQLAKALGIPKSTVGDRIRLIELDPVWLDAIASGKLQVSHAPALSVFSAVPSEYQKKAAANLLSDYRLERFTKDGGTVPVDELPRLLYVAFRDYIKETSKTPGYRGPTIEIKREYSLGKTKYAADIKLWRPCFSAYDKKRRKEQGGRSMRSSYVEQTPIERAMKALKAAGINVPTRSPGKTAAKPAEGEAVILHENQGWARDLDPKVLLEKIDPKTIAYVQNFGGDELWTSDGAAVAAAREAYRQHVEAVTSRALKSLRADLTPRRIKEYAVSGPGASNLMSALGRGAVAKVVALAIGVPIPGADDSFSAENAERLLSALATVHALNLSIPDDWRIDQQIAAVRKDVAFKLPAPPKSKNQQKRDARAAGNQVGDPSRAKVVDVGAIRAAVEAGSVQEARA
jgi:ParB/RepB/Spo0J family partition protein